MDEQYQRVHLQSFGIQMKSYGNLYHQLFKQESIDFMYLEPTKGKKKKRRSAQKALLHPEKTKERIKERLQNYHNDPHTPWILKEGAQRKPRLIISPSYMELAVQTGVCSILAPIFMKSMYEHTYSSIPGRGGSQGKKYVEKFIRKNENVRYYLKTDLTKFYFMIPIDLLKEKLHKIIRDKDFLKIVDVILEVMPELFRFLMETEDIERDTENLKEVRVFLRNIYNVHDLREIRRGIPLGFPTSQWFANFYLTEFDHWVKEEMRMPGYFRYMDDMVFFHNDKSFLHRFRAIMQIKLEKELGLKLKGNWQVVKFHFIDENGKEKYRDLDFMGFRFFRNRTTLRKSILKSAKRTLRTFNRLHYISLNNLKGMISYKGWFRSTNTFTYWKNNYFNHTDYKGMEAYVSCSERRKHRNGFRMVFSRINRKSKTNRNR